MKKQKSSGWPEWRHLLDKLTGYYVIKVFEIVDWITGTPQEAVLEIFRREGIDDFVTFFKGTTDEGLTEYFNRFTTSPLVHEHHLTDLIYEKIFQAFPQANDKVMFIFFKEARFYLYRRSLLNATEILYMLHLQPGLLDEAIAFVAKTETYREIRRLTLEALEIEGKASEEYRKHFKLDD